MFPGGHPSKYYRSPMLLNFSDQTRTGAFNMVWSYTLDARSYVRPNKNALKLEHLYTAQFSQKGGGDNLTGTSMISGLSLDLKKKPKIKALLPISVLIHTS